MRPLGPRDVARATGVSTDTLRHYERTGLLPAVHRTAAGYRQYPAATIERVRLIQRALVVGFSLSELQRVFGVRDKGGAPCRGVRALVGERLEALTRRIDQLVALREELGALLIEWDAKLANTPDGQPAHLLDGLASKPALDRSRGERQSPAGGGVRRLRQ